MQVDSQSPLFDFSSSSTSAAAFSSAPSFEDFFNFDFSHTGSATSPSSPSSSPRTPRTPPSAYALPPAVADDGISSSFFNLFTEDELTKASASGQVLPSSSTAAASYDFLGSLTSLSPFAPSLSSGPSDASPSSDTTSPSAPFAIDPQLVDSPSTGNGGSEFSDDEHDHEADHIDEDMLAQVEPAPAKAAAKSKSRKGTVHSGGITKRTPTHKDREGSHMPTSSVVRDPTKEPEEPGDEWRPTPEEYKRMSSKEKRQLRNKISARNFRVRRKEYISTLEGDIAERDRLLSAIRQELGSTQSENQALREEVNALKKALMAGRGLESLPPPAPIPISTPPETMSPPAASTSSSSSSPSTSQPLLTPNIHKDLPTSPRVGNRGFWGGLGAGGITPVHTTIVPEMGIANLLKKPRLQENLNPILNNLPPPSSPSPPPKQNSLLSSPGLDSFVDTNPFTLKMLDAYRMQLWTKMGSMQQPHQQQQPYHPSTPPSPALHGLAGQLRPHYFSSSKMLANKPASSSSYPSSSLPSVNPKDSLMPSTDSKSVIKQEDAEAFALASQTLTKRLGMAFWDAFSGNSSSRNVDTDKVRRVLEGRAVVRVVDVDEAPAASPPTLSKASSSLSPPSLPSRSMPASPRMPATTIPLSSSQSQSEKKTCENFLTSMLEESMRSLTISKK